MVAKVFIKDSPESGLRNRLIALLGQCPDFFFLHSFRLERETNTQETNQKRDDIYGFPYYN